MNYERATDELRQVKHLIARSLVYTGPEGPRYRDAYDTTVQRKWLVQDGEQREEPYWYRCREDDAAKTRPR